MSALLGPMDPHSQAAEVPDPARAAAPIPERPVRTTGVGSMPGDAARVAAAISTGEFDIPFVAELPARGPGADMVGRSLALIRQVTGDFAATTTPTGWQLAVVRSGGDPGRQMRRAASWLGEDLDAFEEAASGFRGQVKVSLAGPWTLLASVADRNLAPLLGDAGAGAELATALGEAAAAVTADLARRVPGAQRVLVQLDEPALPAVLRGAIPTASGRGRMPVPPNATVAGNLAVVADRIRAAGGQALVHCCASEVPFGLLSRAGVTELSLDLGLMGRGELPDLGQWWADGGQLYLGVVPATASASPAQAARSVLRTWQAIGFSPDDVAARTVLTPTCGMAGADPGWARRAGGVLRESARLLSETG